MITHITKNNRAQYVKLFTKAAEALKAEYGANYPEDFTISSLEEYFQNLEEIAACDTKFLRLPVDEELFEIDLNTRQITVPPSFKKAGLAVQGDDLAEVVYFRTDRFFDATDLNETFILIQWEAPNGNKMASPAYFQEVESETDKLIFGWAVTKEMTTLPGTLRFSVSFVDGESISENGLEVSVEDLLYRLSTLVASININAGLSFAQQGVIKFENRLVDLRNRIKNSPVYPGTVGVAELAEILNYNDFDWSADKIYKNIFTSLVDDITTEGEVETGLPLQAVSHNAGIISYKWFKEGVADPIAQNLGSIRFIPVTYSEDKKKNEAVYFIKEGEGDFRHFEPGKDVWADDEGNVNPLLHERISYVEVNGPGVYFAEVTNKEGMKVSTLTTPKAIVPAPVALEDIVISVEKNLEILEEGKSLLLNSVVSFSEEDPYELVDTNDYDIHYQWFKDGEVIEGANAASYEVTTSGEYSVKAANHWNKEVSKEIVTEVAWPVYPAAVKPVITSFVPAEITGIAMHTGEHIAVTGTILKVDFEPITQPKSKQYVEWQWSDRDGDIAEADWQSVNKLEEYKEVAAEELNGKEFVALLEGHYRAIVHNDITENNVNHAVTTEGIEDAENWLGKVILVVSDNSGK